jgi:hypothetical protein
MTVVDSNLRRHKSVVEEYSAPGGSPDRREFRSSAVYDNWYKISPIHQFWQFQMFH